MDTNPFYNITAEFTNEYTTLTVNKLEQCRKHLRDVGYNYSTDEVFVILSFLAESRVLDIKRNKNNSFEVRLING